MENVSEQRNGAAYEAPAILETFAALEVMGAAEGFEVYSIGNGSNVTVISVAL